MKGMGCAAEVGEDGHNLAGTLCEPRVPVASRSTSAQGTVSKANGEGMKKTKDMKGAVCGWPTVRQANN